MRGFEDKLNKAINCHQQKKFAEAERLYSSLLKYYPNNLDLLYLYGVLAVQIQNFPLAKDLLDKALLENPAKDKKIEILNILAEISIHIGNHQNAIKYYEAIIEQYPENFNANFNLGNLNFDLRNLDKAVEHYKIAIIVDPYCIDAYNNLATTYKLKRDLNNAIECYKKMLDLLPDQASHYYFQIGLAYNELLNFEQALYSYIKAVELNPNYVEAYINLGVILHQSCIFDLALKYSLQALEINPNFLELYHLLGNIYIDTKEAQNAIDISLRGLKLYPDNNSLKFNLARAQMLAGDIENAWEYFQLRRMINERKDLGPCLLDYNGSLEGKTVYVYWDTGLGDTIQFARYLPLLRDTGARVLFKPQDSLESLFIDNDFNIEIIKEGTPESSLKYDFQVNLTSLAYLFKADINNFPFKDRFLTANPEKIREYKEKYFNNDKLKIGLVWQSSNLATIHTFKSVSDISEFFPIARVDKVQLYSLQKGQSENQLENLPEDIKIINLGSTFKDFTDTAAALENLDLLISVDTSVAHLAGSMGKPVWVLMTYVPNWRWFLDREDSPWYDSMRLFRQSDPKSWQDVINNITCSVSAELMTKI